jgi:hypothetical protein
MTIYIVIMITLWLYCTVQYDSFLVDCEIRSLLKPPPEKRGLFGRMVWMDNASEGRAQKPELISHSTTPVPYREICNRLAKSVVDISAGVFSVFRVDWSLAKWNMRLWRGSSCKRLPYVTRGCGSSQATWECTTEVGLSFSDTTLTMSCRVRSRYNRDSAKYLRNG